MLLTNWNLLQVIKKHEHNSRNFFPTEEIKNFGNFFYDCDCVVLEIFVSKLMVAQDPQDDDDVVANLWLLEAWALKEITDHLKALRGAEFSSKLIGLQESHESKSVSIMTQL